MKEEATKSKAARSKSFAELEPKSDPDNLMVVNTEKEKAEEIKQ